MKYFTFMQLPVPEPWRLEGSRSWIGNAVDRLNAWIVDPEERSRVRAELDAYFFRLYGVVRDDVDYIMETFPIVKRKDVAEHGEYRTKRLILEIYDAMRDAIDTGRPYETIVDPPPGHGPRHPAKEETG